MTIDFGPAIGIKKSSAQITRNHRLEDLPGRLVLAVVNFPPRQIGPTMSEVLTLGVPDGDGEVMLIGPWAEVPVGGGCIEGPPPSPLQRGRADFARKRERGEGRQSATAADPPPRSGGGGPPKAVEGAVEDATGRRRAPSTMLRMVPLPRFAGEDRATSAAQIGSMMAGRAWG